jgi:hypothetical protein
MAERAAAGARVSAGTVADLNLGVTATLIDLGQFRNVSRFVLTSTDPNGVSIDNVRRLRLNGAAPPGTGARRRLPLSLAAGPGASP